MNQMPATTSENCWVHVWRSVHVFTWGVGGRDIPSPPSPHVRYHDKCMCFAVQADASTDVGLFGCVILPLVTPRRDIPAFPYMADKSSPMNLTCGQNEQQCAKCLSIMHICSEVGLGGGAFHPEVNVAAWFNPSPCTVHNAQHFRPEWNVHECVRVWPRERTGQLLLDRFS